MSITNCDEFYLKKYKNFISVIVSKFIAKGNHSCADIKEDLIQEGYLALLQWIKKQKSMQDLDVTKSTMEINSALYRYAKQNTGVHMKPHSLKSFYNNYKMYAFDDISEQEIYDQDTVDYRIDFARWFDTLPKKKRKIVELKNFGFNNSQIAKILNTAQCFVSYQINTSIRNSYNAYFHSEQNPAPVRKRKSKSASTAA